MVAVPFIRIGGGWGELNGKKRPDSTESDILDFRTEVSEFQGCIMADHRGFGF